MQFTAKQIAQKLKGTVEGDENALIWKPCRIEEVDEGGITFLANPKYTHYIYERKAAAILISRNFVLEHPVDATLIRVDNPYLCVAKVLHMFNSASGPKRGRSLRSSIHLSARLGKKCYVGDFAFIGRHAQIGDNVQIYPQVYVGDYCKIGDNTILYPGVKIYRECQVGNNCILHAGVTIIHRGAKIDNLCQIAHNVSFGSNTVMASQSGCAGSGKVGDNCIIAGQVGIVGHIKVGDRVTIAAQSGVTRNIGDDAVVLGSPAMPADRQKKIFVMQRKLEEMYNDIQELKKTINER